MTDLDKPKNFISLLENNIAQCYVYCKNCPLVKDCPYTKDKYNEATRNVEKQFSKQLEKYNETFTSQIHRDYNRLNAVESFEKRKPALVKKELNNVLVSDTCKFEKAMAEETINVLATKYPIDEYPEVVYLVEQIIKLRLQDLRLALLHKEKGIATEVFSRGGISLGLKLTPGLHYSVEISSKIADIVQKIQQITVGSKINIKGEFSVKQFMDKIIDMDK